MSRPTFTLRAGGLRSTTAAPAGGPVRLTVDRDMDVPADVLRLRLADRSGITAGDPVDLALGDGDPESGVFTGTVTRVRPDATGVDVVALGTLAALTALRVAAVYEGQTAGAIVRDLAGRAGLKTGTVDDGPALPRFALDTRLNGHAHLRTLADRLGFELYADAAGALMFHDPIGGPPERYDYGSHLLGTAGSAGVLSPAGVDVGGESPMSGQGDRTAHWLTGSDADYRGSAGLGEPRLLVSDPAARTKDLADIFAAGRLAVARRTVHELRLTVAGRPALDLGSAVAAAGTPDSLAAGDGYVRALRHRFGEDTGFVTDLRISLAVTS